MSAEYLVGEVVQSKPGFVCVRFDDLDGVVSQWLPVAVMEAYLNKEVYTLDVGTQVHCLMDSNLEDGCVLGASYNAQDVPATNNKDEWRRDFKDGSRVIVNRQTGDMQLHTKQVTITTTGSTTVNALEAKVTAPKIGLIGDVTIQGDLSVNGDVAMSGQVDVFGDVSATGKILDGGGNTANHSH